MFALITAMSRLNLSMHTYIIVYQVATYMLPMILKTLLEPLDFITVFSFSSCSYRALLDFLFTRFIVSYLACTCVASTLYPARIAPCA